MSSEHCGRILRHYESVWGKGGRQRRWQRGPIHELPSDFCVVEFSPTASRTMWTYGTCCMSLPNDSLPIELHMFAPGASDLHVELLTAVAHYHRTGRSIGLGDSVNFGKPWLPGSDCSFGLVSLPYLDGPRIENLVIPDLDVVTKCYWLVPITQKEVQYKKQAGIEALERQLEGSHFNYLDPTRKSVV
jgi:hypothetical protein